ncbi:MAG: HD domain-containing protein [Desulfovibrio sp.]|nr:HD domain-containing protein [Desulfovibrio sp.]
MPGNIRKSLLQFIFSGSYMKRWNDKLRYMELMEIDKQAHKMIIAWLLCRLAGRGKSRAELLCLEEEVVEGGIFDYLFRLVITDIKPPILYRIKENPDHYQRLARWVLAEAKPHVHPLDGEFWERFVRRATATEHQSPASEILAAAHAYSSAWEFRLLSPLNNAFDDEMPDIRSNFIKILAAHSHLPGMEELLPGLDPLPLQGDGPATRVFSPCDASSAADTARCGDALFPGRSGPLPALSRFANLCGQLRFQKRWSQTPRIPETSVMGHMFMVACYVYFLSIRIGACRARRVNNFFSGLFHDLPEVLTRDIISPVKKSFQDLGQLIREYENSELERRIFAPLEKEGHTCVVARLGYYLGSDSGSEFDDTVIEDGRVVKTDFDALQGRYNQDEYDPKDGEVLKICDILAAYIEAYTAMRNGITSDHIQQAFWRMREQNGKRMLGNIHIGALFTDFD